MEQESFDIASLEGFRADLVASGFEPVPGTERRVWRGPIHPAFDGLTDTRSMDIVFDPGWPYRPPRLFVQGLDTNHSTLDGFVCLWRDGELSAEWETVDGLFSRIEDWCKRARNGWQDDDLPFDAYLNFKSKLPVMATFDFDSLHTGIGSWGDLNGVPANPNLLGIRPGSANGPGGLRGLWFRVGQLQAPPPRNLSELDRHLNRSQRKGLEKALARRRETTGPQQMGGVDIIMFAWQRQERTDLLIMACEGVGDKVEAAALVAEPNDERTLRLRAGPDADVLKGRSAVLFGAGALGGHVAVTLAESGIDSLRIVDREILSPGNVVRHVAGHDHVGGPKVNAVEAAIRNHAPWTNVESVTPQTDPVPTRTDRRRSRNSLKTLMWSSTPPAMTHSCIPSLGLRRDWARRWSRARCSAVDSLDGYRERPWKLTPQSLTGPNLPIIPVFRQATPRLISRSPTSVALRLSTMRRPAPSSPARH